MSAHLERGSRTHSATITVRRHLYHFSGSEGNGRKRIRGAGVVHEFKKLFYSFIVDYNAIGNVAEEGEDSRTITVWIGSGRDQANVIKALIDETFTPEKNINVNVQLVDMNTLLQATLAGQDRMWHCRWQTEQTER